MSFKSPNFVAPTIEVACAAIAQKKLARSNRSRRNVRLLLGAMVGFAGFAAIGYLFGMTPAEGENWFFYCSAAGAVVGALTTACLRQQHAACPLCKHSWEIKEGDGVKLKERMEAWDACPGCGLLMADWALQRAVEDKPRL